MIHSKIVIGSRGSDLALWQAHHIKDALQNIGLKAEIKIIKTQGDKIQHLSFEKMEGKGFFTKELEDALLSGDIDLAVHSFKDLPTTSPQGLIIAALSAREDPADLLLINIDAIDLRKKFNLKAGATIGTSSPRRKSQLFGFRDDVILKDLRGNVPTRIQKLKDRQYDAILLAKAGVDRLNIDLSNFHVEIFDPTEFIPAPAQGVLALQINESNQELYKLLQDKLHNKEVEDTVGIERKILNLFEGGCQLPLGAYCIKKGTKYLVWCSKSSSWDKVPMSLFFESDTRENLAEHVVSKIKSQKPDSVFITRDLKEDSILLRVLTHYQYAVTGKSLLEYCPIPFYEVPLTDWIFFSSSNGVNYFFERQPVLATRIKFGVTGKGTEMALKQHGHKADFIGEHTDIKETGAAFESIVKGKSVLFPKAKDSLRTIQKQLGEDTISIDLDVYEAKHLKNLEIPGASILIFTSPSNVDSFMDKHTVTNQKVIAMGQSTGKKLEAHGIMNYKVPYQSNEAGLLGVLFSL
jgi:hydroxymethylbilane synthase